MRILTKTNTNNKTRTYSHIHPSYICRWITCITDDCVRYMFRKGSDCVPNFISTLLWRTCTCAFKHVDVVINEIDIFKKYYMKSVTERCFDE